MDKQVIIFNLLARALLEIRETAYEGQSNAAFHIADLFHNIPNQLRTAWAEGGDYQEILDWLEMRAEQKGMSSWLDAALKDCRR